MHDIGSANGPSAATRFVRIRTDDWPEGDRAEMFRELHGRDGIRVEPRSGQPLRIDAMLLRFADLGLIWGRRSPLRSEFFDGHDRLILNLAGPAVAEQFGRELTLDRGDAVALSGADRGTLTTTRTGRIATLDFPRGALLPLVKDPRRSCALRIAGDSPALRLLRGYVHAAQAADWTAGNRLPAVTVSHLYDLAAMAVGAERQAQEIASGRGVRAARLRAIKADLAARLDRDVSIDELAARHAVSARYVRMLMETDGTSVTEFVREERLKRARAMLASPRFASRRIAAIAFDVGFNDVSYFNRTFRRRFGLSPSELRAASTRPGMR